MWLHALRALGRGVGHLAFPNSCSICDVPEAERDEFRHGLCNECRRSVANDPFHACPRCALTIGPHADTEGGCAKCRDESLGFDSAIRLGPYDGRLRSAVLRMKSGGGEALAEMMGRVFWETACSRLRTVGFDAVVPVPLHWRRRWVRGYDQAAAVARELAFGLGTTFGPRYLRRVRHTPQQVQPSATARRENVRGAFLVGRRTSLAGKRILLVDDVMTTGSTLSEAARMLRDGGAKSISVAILARR